MNRPLPLIAGLKLAAAETELACLTLALAQVKEDRDELRQERDDWRREAEMLCAEKLREADEQRFAPTSRTHPLGPTRQARIVGSVEGSKRATSLPAFPGAFTEVLHTAGLKRLRCDRLMEARRAR
jgi:hypothetical protein